MKLNHTIQFEFEKKYYEIRIYSEGWKFKVRAYLDNKPANGYTYVVELPTVFNLEEALNIDVIQELVKLSKKDIENKIWDKYVELYLKNTKIVQGSLGCQNCTSRSIESIIIDNRKMHECKDCGNIWYELFTGIGPYDVILHDITNDIEKEGVHEIFTEVLLNTAFRTDSREGLSFQDKLKNWVNINKLKYEFFFKKDITGKNLEAIRFYSDVPRVPPPLGT